MIAYFSVGMKRKKMWGSQSRNRSCFAYINVAASEREIPIDTRTRLTTQAKVDNGRFHTFMTGTRSIVSTSVEKAICLRLLGALNHYTIHRGSHPKV